MIFLASWATMEDVEVEADDPVRQSIVEMASPRAGAVFTLMPEGDVLQGLRDRAREDVDDWKACTWQVLPPEVLTGGRVQHVHSLEAEDGCRACLVILEVEP